MESLKESMERLARIGVDLAKPGSDMTVAAKIDMETGEVVVSKAYDADKYAAGTQKFSADLRDYQKQAANARYVEYYSLQMFDLRFGHMFPVHPIRHTLLNTTALRVVL